MKALSQRPRKRGRIEIIPLIDIMFFLLASFMVVSISKIKLKSLKISLPTDVPAAVREVKEDFINISMSAEGQLAIDRQPIASKEEFMASLQKMYTNNPEQKLLISADREVRHGDVIAILGKIRQAGFQKVAFSIKKESAVPSASREAAPAAPPPPVAPVTSPPAPAAAAPAAQ